MGLRRFRALRTFMGVISGGGGGGVEWGGVVRGEGGGGRERVGGYVGVPAGLLVG